MTAVKIGDTFVIGHHVTFLEKAIHTHTHTPYTHCLEYLMGPHQRIDQPSGASTKGLKALYINCVLLKFIFLLWHSRIIINYQSLKLAGLYIVQVLYIIVNSLK